MPLYFFDLHNGTGLTRDDEGLELADLDEARAVAIENIRSLLSGEVKEGWIDLDGFICVRDEQGGELMQISFQEAVAVRKEVGDGDRSLPDAREGAP